ncbi:hypothetical protein EXIGLDRAFT_707454 [Exidia glandulosa HHB12029]|uniref:Uncharacterized protein n=1 Tax=Exidia glandulosa HHB12029 TaxID=1314781 RepID=A0A165JTE2_EXIGL|nr:hypothetical protein EXIGLDRAFT_707454 [Exidia glandulosa HHB12029]
MSLALAANVADIAGQGPASVLFGVCDIISNSANAVRFNKEAATALATRIRDIVAVLTEEQALEDFRPSPEWTAGISNFKCALDAITQDLQGISKQTFLAQALHCERDAEAIRAMGQRVRDVTALFMTKARIEILDHVQVLNTALESATNAITAPSVPAQRLEPPPAYYSGRGAETESAVTMLDSDPPAYVAILGGPGMGKTSLARAILHHPTLTTRFGPKRYFVACDAADSRMTLLSLLSSAFGIATSSGNAAKRALKLVLRGPSLLVLDNFESAWESPEQRQETENEANPDLSKLLACTDHIPLAIVLLANLAQYESSHTLLARTSFGEFTIYVHTRYGGQIGNYALSIQHLQDSVDIVYSKLPDAHRLLGSSLSFLGTSLCEAGNLISGMSKLKEAIPLLLKTQNHYSLGETEHMIAEVYISMQMNLKALVHIQQALNALQQTHDLRGQIMCFHFSVWANLAVGDIQAALGAIESGETLLANGGGGSSTFSRALWLHVKGAFAAASGDVEAANSFFKGAIMFSRPGDSNELQENCLELEGMLFRSLGKLEQAKGNQSEAENCFIVSVAIFRRQSQPLLLQSLTYLAQVLEDEAATDLLAAIMPPLLHSGLDGLLADAFLTSADIALWQNNTHLAHHRVRSAMRYLEEVDTVKLHERAATMLEKCTAALTV